MDYKNRLKGDITESLFRSFMEDAGYRVLPLGIEQVLRELSALDAGRYNGLGLPQQLRKLPDFFVAKQDITRTHLVEVKYRKRFTPNVWRDLCSTLQEQIQHWSPLVLMLFLGESARPGFTSCPSHFMKVIELHKSSSGQMIFKREQNSASYEEVSCLEADWVNDFMRVQDFFSLLSSRWEDGTLYKTQLLSENLRRLDSGS